MFYNINYVINKKTVIHIYIPKHKNINYILKQKLCFKYPDHKAAQKIIKNLHNFLQKNPGENL